MVEEVVRAFDRHGGASGVDSGGHHILGEGRQQHVLLSRCLGRFADVAAHLLDEPLLRAAYRLADLGDVEGEGRVHAWVCRPFGPDEGDNLLLGELLKARAFRPWP